MNKEIKGTTIFSIVLVVITHILIWPLQIGLVELWEQKACSGDNCPYIGHVIIVYGLAFLANLILRITTLDSSGSGPLIPSIEDVFFGKLSEKGFVQQYFYHLIPIFTLISLLSLIANVKLTKFLNNFSIKL